MADLAKLGFVVDTKGLKKGEQALDNFARKGEQTEKRINKSAKNIGKHFGLLQSAINRTSKEFNLISNNTEKAKKAVVKNVSQMRKSIINFNREVRKSPGLINKLTSSSRISSVNIGRDVKAIDNQFLSLNKTIAIVTTGLVFLGGVQLTKDLIKYSDTWKNVNGQIRQVTKSEDELIKTRKQLLALTRDTRTDLTVTVDLFAEMTRGTSELNISSDRLLGVTRTLNNLFLAGSKPISEVTGAIRQLNQGFASGVLRGDEFNSVAEGAPKILDALTAKLRLTRGELREFAATGGLTANILVSALEDYSLTAEKLAAQTEKTFGQSIVNSKTNIIEFVGEAENLNKVIGSTGKVIENLTENLGALTNAGTAALAVIGVGLAGSMLKSLAATISITVSTIAYNIQLARMAGLTGLYAVKAGVATVAMNGLAIATRFLLGPWGLLLTAVAAGTFAFIASKDASRDAEDQHKKHAESLNKLATEFEKYSKGRLGTLYVEAQRKAIEIDQRRIDTNEKLIRLEAQKVALLETSSGGGKAKALDPFSNEIENLKKQLVELNVASKEQERILNAVGVVFDKGLPQASEMTDRTKEQTEATLKQIAAQDKVNVSFEKQISLLSMQTLQLSTTADEYEIFSAQLQAIANGASPEMVKAITDVIKVNQKLRKSVEDAGKVLNFKQLQDQAKGFGGAWSKTGSIIIDTFGSMSDAITDHMKKMDALQNRQKEIDKSRKAGKIDSIQLSELEAELAIDTQQAQLSALGKVSKASASLFKERTAASKAFAALNKIIAISEIFLSLQKISASNAETTSHVANEAVKSEANAFTAITSAFSLPPPLGFIAGAAMIAVMASLLGKSFGGGSSSDPTEANQATQGTGTLLGSSEKSQSIIKSQERFEDIAIDQLAELRGIRGSLNSLSSSIEKLAISVITGGVGEFQGDLSGSGSSLFTGVFSLFDKTTKKVVDQGIIFVSQSLGDIMTQGIVQAEEFFNVEVKKSKLFGLFTSKKLQIETQDIDIAIKEQMAAIFGHIGDTVLQSADLLGFETVGVLQKSIVESELFDVDRFGDVIGGRFQTIFESVELNLEDALSRFQVNIGQISLEGLTGEEIQQELQAVFSQQADLIAEFLVPSIVEYQKIGEGLFDTLLRVTQEQIIFNDSIKIMGVNLSEVSNVMKIDIAQSIIELTGGLDKFSDLSSSFVENFLTDAERFEFLQTSLTEAFDSLGLSLVTNREEFKDLVQGIDVTTLAGQELLSSLLMINPALAQFIDELEDLEEEQERIRQQQQESLRNAATEAFSMLEKSIDLEKQRVQAVLDGAREAHNAELDRIGLLRTALEEENVLRRQNLENAKGALTDSFNAEISRIQETANLRIKSLEDERSAIEKTASAMRSLVSRINNSLGLSGSNNLVSALASARRGDFTQAQSLNISGLTNLDTSGFESAEDLAIQQAINQNRLKTIGDLAQDQLTESEMLINSIDSQIALTQSIADDEISVLNNQLNSLLDIDTSILGVDDAIEKFNVAQQELEALNFEQEIEKFDMLIDSANEVFQLHEEGYRQELIRLDGILSSNKDLFLISLNINSSILTIPEAIRALETTIKEIPVAPVVSNTINSENQMSELKDEIAKLREENAIFQREIVKNTKMTASASQESKLNGVDVRIIP